MEREINDDGLNMKIVNVTVSPDTMMEDVLDEFSCIKDEEFDEYSDYLNEIMGWYNEDEHTITVSMLLADWGEIFNRTSVTFEDRPLLKLESVPKLSPTTVGNFFDRHGFEKDLYL